MTLDDLISELKSDFVAAASKQIMAWLVARLPFLAWPVVSQIATAVLIQILGLVAKFLEMQGYFVFIGVKTDHQATIYLDAAKKNKIAQTSGTPEEKARARQAKIDAFRALAQFTR